MSDSDSEGSSGKRHFQYINEKGEASGRYSGIKPKQAANKVFSALWRVAKNKGNKKSGEIRFAIRECTRGSKRKTYYYKGVRQKLDEPTKVPIQAAGGEKKMVVYNYSNKVMKDTEATKKAQQRAHEEEGSSKKGGNKKSKKGSKESKKKSSKKTEKKTTKKESTKKGGKKEATKKAAKKPTKKESSKKESSKKESSKKTTKKSTKKESSKKDSKKATKKPAKKASKK